MGDLLRRSAGRQGDCVRAIGATIATGYNFIGAGPVGQPSPDTSPPPSGLPRASSHFGGGAVVLMAYIPEWERLFHALDRVMAGRPRFGATKDAFVVAIGR